METVAVEKVNKAKPQKEVHGIDRVDCLQGQGMTWPLLELQLNYIQKSYIQTCHIDCHLFSSD